MFMLPMAEYNPYIAGKVVGQNGGFFDREHILEAIETTLSAPNQNVIILHGQRRIGKSSILRRLKHTLPAQRFLPIFCDLQLQVRRPLGQMLGELAMEIVAAVEEWAQPEQLGEIASGSTTAADWELLKPEQFDDLGDYFRTTFLPTLYTRLGEHCDLVLLLDEFDVLDQSIDLQQTPINAVERAFFPFLQELLERTMRLKCVFSIGRRIEELSINKAAFKSWPAQRVSVFDDHNARDLITLAERRGTLKFDQAAIDLILELTAGHPYLTQLLCQNLWDHAHADRPLDVPSIDTAAVEAAATSALNAGKNTFEWIWAELAPAERLILAAIAGATDRRSGVTEQQLLPLLQAHSRHIKLRDMELALRTLIEREMLHQAPDGYQFHIELMRHWAAMYESLAKVSNDLNRVLPLAEQHYHTANAYYARFDLENAQDELRKTLRTNPNHAQAQVLLGQILRELGKLPEAIDQLDLAYRYGEREARDPLIRALSSLGSQLEDENPHAALNSYARALEISPRETHVRLRFDKIVRQLHEAEIASYEHKQQWDAAIKLCQKLASQFPHDKGWRREIRRLEGKRRDDQARRQVKRLLDIDPGRTPPNPAVPITGPLTTPVDPPLKSKSDLPQSFTSESEQTATNPKPQPTQRARSYSMIWGGVIAILVLASATYVASALALFPQPISPTEAAAEATASIASTTLTSSTRAPPATTITLATQTAQPFTMLPILPSATLETATFAPDTPSPPNPSTDESPTPPSPEIPSLTPTSTNTVTPTTPTPTLTSTPEPTPTPTSTPEPTPTPTSTPEPTPTPTSTSEPTPTPTPEPPTPEPPTPEPPTPEPPTPEPPTSEPPAPTASLSGTAQPQAANTQALRPHIAAMTTDSLDDR